MCNRKHEYTTARKATVKPEYPKAGSSTTKPEFPITVRVTHSPNTPSAGVHSEKTQEVSELFGVAIHLMKNPGRHETVWST